MKKQSPAWRSSENGDLMAEIGDLRLIVLTNRDRNGLVPFLIMRRQSLDLPYVLVRSGTAENARAAMDSAWRVAAGTRGAIECEAAARSQDHALIEDLGSKGSGDGSKHE